MTARRASPEHVAALRDAAAHYAEVCADTTAAVEAVSAFFRAIVAGTENRALALAHEPALRLLQSSLGLLIDRIPQARERIRTAQRRLVMTIEAKDGAAAREWMEKHIHDFRRGLEVAGIDLSYRVSV